MNNNIYLTGKQMDF